MTKEQKNEMRQVMKDHRWPAVEAHLEDMRKRAELHVTDIKLCGEHGKLAYAAGVLSAVQAVRDEWQMMREEGKEENADN